MQPGQNGNALELPLHIEHGVLALIQANGNLGLNGGLAIQQVHVQDGGFDDVFANMDWMNVDLMDNNPQKKENGNHILQPVQQVPDGGFWNKGVDFDWLNIFHMVGNDDQQEAVVGIQENGGWGNVAEPDEEIGEPLLELIQKHKKI
ncbi:unnamed protein product [Arabis nemorensis]|uniref:Uncharacterized protein n=1 Tax=Arabis nemorensis TaxID=586526 RepID=A0A565CDP1_9BRAS|nr:unnamed protein product [Arabis nemorensis]